MIDKKKEKREEKFSKIFDDIYGEKDKMATLLPAQVAVLPGENELYGAIHR
jgi:hypothetical protein